MILEYLVDVMFLSGNLCYLGRLLGGHLVHSDDSQMFGLSENNFAYRLSENLPIIFSSN